MGSLAAEGKGSVIDADYAEVAVHVEHGLREPMSYAVPPGLGVRTGHAVYVPYGPTVVQGVVLALRDAGEGAATRSIQAIAEPEPMLDPVRAGLARWLSATYLAPLWDCVALCLPPGFGQRRVTMVSAVDVPALLPPSVPDQKVLTYVASKGRVPLDTLRERVPGTTEEQLKRLQALGYLSATMGLTKPTARAKMQRRLRLRRLRAEAASQAAEWQGVTGQTVTARILAYLAEHGDAAYGDVRVATKLLPKHVEQLAREGWLEEYQERIERSPFGDEAAASAQPPELTRQQQAAIDAIDGEQGTHLLFGVTGSGKTEVYLGLIDRVLARGQGAIVLVPEIALTPQAMQRYGQRYGGRLAVMHSGLGIGERFDEWDRVRRGEARVVMGSRSAIFAPLDGLGLVIIDEEHEWTYKETERQPRYHARAVAEELCRRTGAALVLGSATPDIATYHASELGDVRRVELPQRVYRTAGGGTELGQPPLVEVVDLRVELAAGNTSVFSRPLAAAVEGALAAGEQAILFVNRRGTARSILCRDCGYTAKCPTCDVNYSLSRESEVRGKLVCHACGGERVLTPQCPRCQSRKYRPFGVGTQRVEDLARERFPRARIARWDMESASGKGAHERLMALVEGHEVDILVGTQMLAKGLDLPAMQVVGVVDADVGANIPDFRAHERVFQLLTQVAGRAGRRGRQGLVYIQTYNPEHPAILHAAHQDYRSFYAHEIAHRRRAGYPPFSRLVRLTASGYDSDKTRAQAERLVAAIRKRRDIDGRTDPEIRGPSPAMVPRVRGRYRWQVLLRGRDPAADVEAVNPGKGWAIDIDPIDMT